MDSGKHLPSPSIEIPSPSIEIGRVLRDRYVIEECLASGATGTVYRALDRYRADLSETKQRIAIKILHQSAGNHPQQLKELRREFYCTQTLVHPNIIQVYDLDRDGDIDFFTMELVTGELLIDVTGRLRNAPLPRAYAWKIIEEIGSALAHAHARHVVHADLKPRNIMITHSGEVRILDFGASAASADGPADMARHGNARSEASSGYASCELLDGRSADRRDDVYAFACIAYELLAGAHPFQRRPATVARDLGIVPQRPPRLSGRQWRALARGLSWHRAGRSVTIVACLQQLNAAGAMASRLPAIADLRAAPVRPRPSASLWAATMFAALPIAAGIGVLLLARPGPIAAPVAAAQAPIAQAPSAPQMGQAPQVPTSETATAPPAAVPPHQANRRRPSDRTSAPIMLTAADFSARMGERFAEIRVHRSSRSNEPAQCVWWTEAATAKPGIDYVPQGKVTQTFAKGTNSASFFIKLIPNASRTQSRAFHLVIAAAGRDASSHPVARATIRLPAVADPILAQTP